MQLTRQNLLKHEKMKNGTPPGLADKSVPARFLFFFPFEVRRKFDPNIEPDTPQFGNLKQQADEVELA